MNKKDREIKMGVLLANLGVFCLISALVIPNTSFLNLTAIVSGVCLLLLAVYLMWSFA